MKSITLNIPDIDSLVGLDLSLYLAAKLYEEGILTAGQASQVANVSKRVFIELIGKYGVSVFSTEVEDILNDITVQTK